MAELTYLVNWGKNKETAWSGTNYSLYKALQKYYSIKDVNLKGNRWINAFLHRILRLNTSVIGFYQKRMQSCLKRTGRKISLIFTGTYCTRFCSSPRA